MGILNVTPDSFSDGGSFTTLDAALHQAETMLNQGASLIDVGGESTRPGAAAVSEQEELDRVIPVIEALVRELDAPVSIDTSKAAVMEAAVVAGAAMINDVYALQSEGALATAAGLNVPVCLMHMQGQPRTMQQNPQYQDVVQDVVAFLRQRIDCCVAAGLGADKLIVDPGIGFGKTTAHNLTLLKHISEFACLGRPVLIGASRKSTIGQIIDKPPHQRAVASAAIAGWAVTQGASLVRAHDVAATVDAVRMCYAIAGAE
jgi:dihydropteroate synthase